MRRIKKVGVLGSGVMGSGIAIHLANCGLDVLMLDMVNEAEKGNRNMYADTALAKAAKSSPAPGYTRSVYGKVKTGNFADDLTKLSDRDWIIEVVKEDLQIKQALYEKIEEVRKPGTLITTNTSGIPINLLAKGRSDDFRRHFCGTHFFNPPRYLALLEIIPGADTDPEVIDFLMSYGRKYLGKTTVLAKDTPAFIANRIGVYSMASVFDQAAKLGVSIQNVDKLTGAALGRPKSGTFRLADLVGLDTAVSVIEGIKKGNPADTMAQSMVIPEYLQMLVDQRYLGEKTGQGFYQKTKEKDAKGRPVILGLNLATRQYEADSSPALDSLGQAKQIDDAAKRIPFLFNHADSGGQLVRNSLASTFMYAAGMVPEIADDLYAIDDAMRAGYAWDYGPFEYWDLVGLQAGIDAIKANGGSIRDWVQQMAEAGKTAFYVTEKGTRKYYDPVSADYKNLPGRDSELNLHILQKESVVASNDEIRLYDIGDQVLCLEFTSKMNAIGGGILQGLNDAIDKAESGDWRGLVIGNHSRNFTVGANLMMIAMMAYEQDFDELDRAVRIFQQTTMRCRYSKVPVVAATQGYVFGGGCELIMHCDSTAAAAESYIGLVEAGVGLLPGGGGTKEFALRAADGYSKDEVKIPVLLEHFKTIATAAVATSAYEAFELGYLNAKDFVVLYQPSVIQEAKTKVLQLSENYVQPTERNDIDVMGRQGLGALYAAAHSLKLGGYASDHDVKIARKIAWVLCGGDLSQPQKVSENYLLHLEREAFLSLCGEQKTLERIQHMLEKGKPLRN